MARLTVSIHKLTSCSGCQLGFINQGERLMSLPEYIEILHFIEAGINCPDCTTDIAFVEGSVSTQDDLERLKEIRKNSKLLVTIGACATSGGVQALRNLSSLYGEFNSIKQQVYASPEFVTTLEYSMPVSEFVSVDYELWGCPVSPDQLWKFLSQLISGVKPKAENEKLCMECKRRQTVCVLVTGKSPCLGPVTRTGCGAICPSFGKACYSCYGPAEQSNARSLANRLTGIGYLEDEIAQRFAQIHSNTSTFRNEIEFWTAQKEKGGSDAEKY